MQPGGVATPTQAKCSAHSAPHAPGTGPRAPTALPPASVPNKEKAGAPAAYVPLPVGFLGMTGVVGVSRVRGLGIHSNGRRALGAGAGGASPARWSVSPAGAPDTSEGLGIKEPLAHRNQFWGKGEKTEISLQSQPAGSEGKESSASWGRGLVSKFRHLGGRQVGDSQATPWPQQQEDRRQVGPGPRYSPAPTGSGWGQWIPTAPHHTRPPRPVCWLQKQYPGQSLQRDLLIVSQGQFKRGKSSRCL